MKAQRTGANPVSPDLHSCAGIFPVHVTTINLLYSDAKAAPMLGVAEPTLRKSRCTGVLLGHPAPVFIKQGRRVRYREEDLLAWLAQFQPCRNTLEAQRFVANVAYVPTPHSVSPDICKSGKQHHGEK